MRLNYLKLSPITVNMYVNINLTFITSQTMVHRKCYPAKKLSKEIYTYVCLEDGSAEKHGGTQRRNLVNTTTRED